MELLQSIILGSVQGLTEFIPVSSSGHLVIAEYFLSGAGDHLFLEFINIGTTLALIVYFWKKIIHIIKDVVVHKKYSLARNIVVTSIPAGLIGFLFAGLISSSPFFTSVVVVVVTLTVVGIVMIALESLPKASPVETGAALSWQRALVIGLAQVVALIPGVSRSGATIISGRLAGLAPAAAAEYSFLASIPIMLGVTLKLALGESDRQYLVEHLPMLVIGNIAAFITGILAIRFLLNYLSRHDLRVFGWYRLGLAAIVCAVILLQ